MFKKLYGKEKPRVQLKTEVQNKGLEVDDPGFQWDPKGLQPWSRVN